MKLSQGLLFFIFCIFITSIASQETLTIEQILGTNPKIERLSNEFQFTEGPLWIEHKNIWIFSDIPANKMYEYSEEKGFRVFRSPSNYSNGSALDAEGNLITVQHDRTITKTDQEGKITVIASEYEGKKLNSPNDLAISRSGEIYFTDPHYGLIGYGPKKAPEEQKVRGIYRIKKDGKIELLSGELKIPNGLGFSPEEDILYVSNSQDGNIYAFDVTKEGTLANLRLFAKQSVPEGKDPLADGLKVDRLGNVYAAAPAGVAIYAPTGQFLGDIKLPVSASNLAWGEKDYKTLLITVHNSIYRVITHIGGFPPSRK